MCTIDISVSGPRLITNKLGSSGVDLAFPGAIIRHARSFPLRILPPVDGLSWPRGAAPLSHSAVGPFGDPWLASYMIQIDTE